MRYLTIVLLSCYCSVAFASSGAYSNDASDSRSLGNANAVTARCDSPATNWYNPAGLTKLENSQLSATLMYEDVNYNLKSDQGLNVDGEPGKFVIPSLFYTQKINKDIAIGIGLNSAYGLASEWDNPITDYVSTKAELKTFNCNPNIAYAFNDSLSIAFGLDLCYADGNINKKINQTFLNSYLYSSMTGINTILLSSDAKSKMEGNDKALSWNTGVLLILNENIQLGLSYRNKIDFNLDGKLKMDELNGPASSVFGGVSYDTSASLDIAIPSTLNFGIAYKVIKSTTIELDFEYAEWSTIDEFKIKYNKETNPLRLAILNSGNPVEKDWKDTLNTALGIEHVINEKYSVYVGTAYRPSPIPEKTFDPMVPSFKMNEFMGGFSINFEKSKLDFVLDYIYAQPRAIDNTVGNDVGASIGGKYKMDYWGFGVSYTYKL
jgi:long-chain fatty acid transport protein